MTKAAKNGVKPEKSKFKKVYDVVTGIVTAGVFIFVCFIVIVVILQKSSGKENSLFGYYMFDVLTESMEPTIEAGDVILSKKAVAGELKKGDIITFVAPQGKWKGYNITHRINRIELNEDGSVAFIKTKGDNAGGEDSWELKPSEVKAVFVRKLPFIAKLHVFMAKPAGFFVLIALPLMLVAGLCIAGLIKNKIAYDAEKKKEQPVTLDDLSEEEKQALLKDYPDIRESKKETAAEDEEISRQTSHSCEEESGVEFDPSQDSKSVDDK